MDTVVDLCLGVVSSSPAVGKNFLFCKIGIIISIRNFLMQHNRVSFIRWMMQENVKLSCLF